ncbi:MAG: nucleotidyltransferase domain-containing protein [Nanoarchaeota archaeon]
MENLKSYASYFSAYLVNNLVNEKEIKKIILFGSVSRGNDEKDCDVDIFLELNKNPKKIEDELRQI